MKIFEEEIKFPIYKRLLIENQLELQYYEEIIKKCNGEPIRKEIIQEEGQKSELRCPSCNHILQEKKDGFVCKNWKCKLYWKLGKGWSCSKDWWGWKTTESQHKEEPTYEEKPSLPKIATKRKRRKIGENLVNIIEILKEKKQSGRKFKFRKIISQANIRYGGTDWSIFKNKAIEMGFKEIKKRPCILQYPKEQKFIPYKKPRKFHVKKSAKERINTIKLLEEKKQSGQKFQLRDILIKAGYVRSDGRCWNFFRNKAIEMGFNMVRRRPHTFQYPLKVEKGKVIPYKKPTKRTIRSEEVNTFIRTRKPEEQFNLFDVLKALNLGKEYYQNVYWILDDFVKRNVIERYTTYIRNQKRVFYTRKIAHRWVQKEEVESKEEPELPPYITVEGLKRIFEEFKNGSFGAEALTRLKTKSGDNFSPRIARSLINWIVENKEYAEKITDFTLLVRFPKSEWTEIHVIL